MGAMGSSRFRRRTGRRPARGKNRRVVFDDGAAGDQLAVGGSADQRLQQLAAVLADARRRPREAARRRAHARRDVVHRHGAEVGVVELDQAFALDHVAVVHQLRGVADRADGHLGCVEEGEVLGQRLLRG